MSRGTVRRAVLGCLALAAVAFLLSAAWYIALLRDRRLGLMLDSSRSHFMADLDNAIGACPEIATCAVPSDKPTEIILVEGYTPLSDEWLTSNTGLRWPERVRLREFTSLRELPLCITIRGGEVVCVESASSALRFSPNPLAVRTGMSVRARLTGIPNCYVLDPAPARDAGPSE